MLKISEAEMERIEEQYPGLKETVLRFEAMKIPACPTCGSDDTASIQIGIIGRTITLAAATSKAQLFPNKTFEGEWFCNVCRVPFD